MTLEQAVWEEQLRRALARPEHREHAHRYDRGISDQLANVPLGPHVGKLPPDAGERLDRLFDEIGEAVGTGARPWT
jgi:hypothetical protein